MTYDAKQQLQRILVDQGFPEECFVPRHKSISEADSFIVSALLCVGLYPNVAIYEDKRKVSLKIQF